VLDAHEVGGGALLLRAPGGERGGRQRALGGAGITVGTQHVGHLAAGRDPRGDDAARTDLRVIGMREHHHGALGDVGGHVEPPAVR